MQKFTTYFIHVTFAILAINIYGYYIQFQFMLDTAKYCFCVLWHLKVLKIFFLNNNYR